MKPQEKIIGLLIILFMYGCASPSEESSFDMEYEPTEEQTYEGSIVESAEQRGEFIVERKLIKEGSIEFETDDIKSTRALIFESIEKYKGYTSSDQEYKSIGRISNTIIIRVPANNFDLLVSVATKEVSKFDSKNIEVKDVTEEFVDIQARLKTKKELESRYLDILKKANSVTEMLEVEKQLGQLRAEIESVEGRLKYLESKVSFSTLTMSFYQIVPNETKFGNAFKNGFIKGWDNLIWFFVILTNVWPFILIGIALLFVSRIWRKKRIKEGNKKSNT